MRLLQRLKTSIVFKFKRPSSLFTIIIFIPFFYFVFFNLRNRSTGDEEKEIIKKADQLNEILLNHPLRTANFKAAFEKVLADHCPPNDNKLELKCLVKLNELENQIQDQRAKSPSPFQPCQDCLYDPLTRAKHLLYFHTFWQIDQNSGAFNRRVIRLQILSFLATQNPCCSKLIVWKLENFDSALEAKLTKSFEKYVKSGRVEFKLVKLTELCKMTLRGYNQTEATGSSFVKNQICQNPDDKQLNNKALVSFSDFVRFFVLDLYGGVYVDGDVFYLRDLRMLFMFDFIYKWSYTDQYNTAIIGIRKQKNPSMVNFYGKAVLSSHSVEGFASYFHPFAVTNHGPGSEGVNIYDYKGLKLLHSSMLDPAWLCNDAVIKLPKHMVCGLADFNDQVTADRKMYTPLDKTFFPGAFTFHIHLKNAGNAIRNGSFFVYFEEFWSEKLGLQLVSVD